MGWSGKATPDGRGGYTVSGGYSSSSGRNGPGCAGFLIILAGLLVVGYAIVNGISLSNQQAAVSRPVGQVTTLQDEGLTFQANPVLYPVPCTDPCDGTKYERDMMVTLVNSSSSEHVVAVCAPQVQTAGTGINSGGLSGLDCLSYTVAAGSTLHKFVSDIKSLFGSDEGFKVVGTAAVVAVDDHPIKGLPYTFTRAGDGTKVAICENGGCVVPTPA
jgi:hypothetical protein